MSLEVRQRLSYSGFTLDVDLTLPERGITALFGPSGCGKTTLLRCIAGLERGLGQLRVDGTTWQDETHFLPTHQRPLGYVFQEASLFPHLTVRGNLVYGMCRTTATDFSRLSPVVDLLGIGTLLERKPDRLSGGERQRVAIARALLTNPRLLLMDEPLAALDMARKQEILPYLERLHDELEIPLLYVSHAPDEVARLADHLVVMEAGRAVAQGPLTEVLTRLDLPLSLGEDAGTVFPATIVERDAEWHLARVAFAGGELWVRDNSIAIGTSVRVRILARDVSIAVSQHEDTSITNVLSAVVTAQVNEDHPALVLLQLRAGNTPLLARLTRRSAHRLALEPGRTVWIQIKTVALIG